MKRCKVLILGSSLYPVNKNKFFIGVNYFRKLKYLLDISLKKKRVI